MVHRRGHAEIDVENNATPKEKVPNISYFTLYRFASKTDRTLIAIALLATFVAGLIIPYAITVVSGMFQDMIVYAKDAHFGKQDSDKFLSQMHKFGVLYSSIGVVLFLGGYLGTALMNISAINQIYKIRQEYLRAALNQDFAYFDTRQTGDFASKMGDDVIKLEDGIGDKVSALVYNMTVAVGCVSMAIYKGWKLALLCLITSPITFLLVGLTSKLANRLSKKHTIASGTASAVAQEVLTSIRTVYSFNGQKKELLRYQKPLAVARKVHIQKELFTGLSLGFMFFCVFASYALSFYFGIYLVINDPENYNADVMFSVFFGVMTGMGNLGMVGSLVGTFASSKGAGAQIFYLLNNVPTINPLLDRGLKPKTLNGNIELKNVVFKYPARSDVPVLNGISLTVSHGQSVALVGSSGCGKSTVISLICRYYDVLEGSIKMDGHDVRDLSVTWLRAHIGLVSQEPTLFNATVRENIRYGRDDATDAEVEAAAKNSNAHYFTTKLPKGYDTLVGERGASLSGGQKQRIAIARALIRNPVILLLDEATSALDLSSEAKVQKALEIAAKGRTTVTVAHRLSTIRNVDLIYVLHKGEVVETGTHEQLMGNKGIYHNLVITQEPNILSAPTRTSAPIREESETKDEDEIHTTISVSDQKKEAEVQKLSFWSVVKLNSPEWKYITLGSLGSIVIGFSMPLFIVVFGDMFGEMSSPDPNTLMDKAKSIAISCVSIGLVMGISSLVEFVSFGVASAYLTERLRVRMFSHMLEQHIGFFDDVANSTGALCARLSAEAAYVQAATGQRIGIFLQGMGSVGLAMLLAILFEWRVGLVALAFFPILAIIIYHQAKETGRESQGNALSIENSTKIAIEAVSNIRTVASLGRERKFLSEYAAQLKPTLALSHRSAHCKGVVAGMSRSLFNFVNAAAMTYGGHLMVSNNVAYENILVTTQSLQMASGSLQNAFTFAPDFQKGIKAATRIDGQLKQKTKIYDPENPVLIGFIPKGEVGFQNVEFSYPTRPHIKVLRGLNVKVETGKTVALVGQSGCGKSTVIQLLQRFYDPDSGFVSLDNYPIQQLRVDELRSAFGLVSQEPVLFGLTIKENIAYGVNSRNPTMSEVIDAAKQANIHDFIISLPENYETNIGSKGVQLSGGQKQRIAIARALIRKPKILLLDEATSALDTESEKVVLEALDAARAGRTCIVITHRLSTVRDADVINVIEAGRLVEAGTHEQLIQAKGVYANLYNAGV